MTTAIPSTGTVQDPETQRALDEIRKRATTMDSVTIPNTVAAGANYVIPAGHQMFFADVMDVQGILDVQGELVNVDAPPSFLMPLASNNALGMTTNAADIPGMSFTTDRGGDWEIFMAGSIGVAVAGAVLSGIQVLVAGVVPAGGTVLVGEAITTTVGSNTIVARNVPSGTVIKLQYLRILNAGTQTVNNSTMVLRQV